jgi:hypothetical protein
MGCVWAMAVVPVAGVEGTFMNPVHSRMSMHRDLRTVLLKLFIAHPHKKALIALL